MLRLSAFADEISPDLAEQIRVCRKVGVTHFELRSIDKINVLDFDPALRATVRQQLQDNGIGVVCIGSPIGKVKIDQPWDAHFDRFKIAVDMADFFAAPFIRIFSYYPADDSDDIQRHRAEVIRRMRAKLDYIDGRDITLLHENEKDIFGEGGQACLDLMQSIESPQFRNAFDFANFVQAGESPLDNWPMLKPYTAHIHIKDATLADGKVVPAGDGDGHIEAILADAYASGYRGFLSLEPHLAAAGQFAGFSGPTLFQTAGDALKAICARQKIPLAAG